MTSRAAPLLLLCAACSSSGKLRLVDAPAGVAVAPWIAARAAESWAAGRQAVVYVGAPWCEPCNRFHQAAARGELDRSFPTLDVLIFDEERDGERLTAAGYDSRLIPLFALPAADGSATDRRMEGGVKGDAAALEIVPRLAAILRR